MLNFSHIKSKHINHLFIFCFINISIFLAGNNILFGNSSPMCNIIHIENDNILPQISFKIKHIDLGKVKKGETISFFYEFTNTGIVDISIDFVSGCDCTELDWPVKTFKPGESGKIDVLFFSSKKDKSETVEIDVLLKNIHPDTQNPIFEILSYSYQF